ncbi:altered inheritance of mitochondria protein 21 [Xylariomycetidae sp. FL0641]|nr:altered inheritance of mitochondria protein 21 [Xylariomycetidae sp. FL0641]
MSSAATMQSTPSIPPRPSRGQDKSNGSSAPLVPPRPTKRFNRSVSPNPDRFAPSPLNESPFLPAKSPRHSQSHLGEELIERSKSVDMPGVGEEGQEYAAAIEGLNVSSPEEERQPAGSPEQTRTVGADIQLHAPKPTMPAVSAKQRVAAVTRTDSDRAASFGIGRPTSTDLPRGLKKKASTTSQLSHNSENHVEDEQGIPEIGQRVPMLLNAGDVQAPSPAPPRAPSVDGSKTYHHHRKLSSRSGFGDLPPGSYGLHGHGVASTDKLEKAYYEKHPDLLQKEHYNHLHDRVHDYSMSSEDLNKIVRDTASRGAGLGASAGYVSTPSEQVGYQATDEYTSRMSSPRPSSRLSQSKRDSMTSPLKASMPGPDIAVDDTDADADEDDGVIHVDERGEHRGYVKYGDEGSAEGHDAAEEYGHPILASDEVAKGPSPYELHPAVPPPRSRHGSAYEMEEPRSRPTSRPSSRPTSIYSTTPAEMRYTPLEDVEEYEPLFPEDDKGSKTQAEKIKEYKQRFPSRDIWEDAPSSVHSTAEVHTPDVVEALNKSGAKVLDIPTREGETPAQAFARKQEELAEKEGVTPDAFLFRQQKSISYAERQPHLFEEMHARPNMANRFPSRDVWEDTPDSLQFTTTVSTPQSAEEPENEGNAKAAAKPAIPARPPRKQGSGDDASAKPAIPGRPKPQIPARPAKPATESKESDPTAAKAKPAVPARPMGGKIAALQAGFMSDLNKRLQLGPSAPKKEESPEEAAEPKEKVPLSDARKGRARGPQRRAPTKAKSPSPGAPPPVSSGKPVLSFSMPRVLFSIDEEGTMTVDDLGPEKQPIPEPTVVETKPEDDTKVETKSEDDTKVEAKAEEPTPSEEPAPQTEKTEEPAVTSKPVEEEKPSEKQEGTVEETKTLATNMAGESVLEETVEKKEQGDEVAEVKDVEDKVLD